MPRTVSSPGPKSHGFCGQRGFQEAQLNIWADTQSVRNPRHAEDGHSVMERCVSTPHAQQAIPPNGSRVLTCCGASDLPTLTFVSYSYSHFFGTLRSGLP